MRLSFKEIALLFLTGRVEDSGGLEIQAFLVVRDELPIPPLGSVRTQHNCKVHLDLDDKISFRKNVNEVENLCGSTRS